MGALIFSAPHNPTHPKPGTATSAIPGFLRFQCGDYALNPFRPVFRSTPARS